MDTDRFVNLSIFPDVVPQEPYAFNELYPSWDIEGKFAMFVETGNRPYLVEVALCGDANAEFGFGSYFATSIASIVASLANLPTFVGQLDPFVSAWSDFNTETVTEEAMRVRLRDPHYRESVFREPVFDVNIDRDGKLTGGIDISTANITKPGAFVRTDLEPDEAIRQVIKAEFMDEKP